MSQCVKPNKISVGKPRWLRRSLPTGPEYEKISRKDAFEIARPILNLLGFSDDIKDFKSKTFDKLTAKNTAAKSIEKRINKITARIPSSLNLPSKEEVQELMTGVDGISRKVDKLNKLYA